MKKLAICLFALSIACAAQTTVLGKTSVLGNTTVLGKTGGGAVMTNVAGETGTGFGGIAGGGNKQIVVTAVTGDLLIMHCLTVYASTTTNSTITESLGNTITVIDSTGATGTTNYIVAWIKVATPGSDTITCTGAANSNYMDFSVSGYNSTTGWLASPVDQHQISSVSCNLTSGTTTQAIELAIGGCSGGSTTNPAGWTQILLYDGGNLVSMLSLAVTGTTNFNPGLTFATVGALDTFKPN